MIAPHADKVQYAGYNDNRLLSPALWAEVDWRKGRFLFDDFMASSITTGTTKTNIEGECSWTMYHTQTQTVPSLPTTITVEAATVQSWMGVLHIAISNNAGDQEGFLKCGETTNVQAMFASTGGKKLVFECRVKLAQIAAHYWCAGLGQASSCTATDTPLTDDHTTLTTAIGNFSFVGFGCVGATIQAFFKKLGGTIKLVDTDVGTIVADTWVKLGIVFDPKNYRGKHIRWFVDGVEVASFDWADYADATYPFPADEGMALNFALKNTTTTAAAASLDWHAFYQEEY